MKEINFDGLAKAGVTQAEFGTLLQVSRVTVSSWIHGKFGVHPMRVGRVERLLRVISQARKDGQLPLDGVARDKRMAALKKVLVPYLKNPAA